MALSGQNIPLDGAASVQVDGDDDATTGRSYVLRCFATGDPTTLVHSMRVDGASFDPTAAGASVGAVFAVRLDPGEHLHVGAPEACTVAVVSQGSSS